MIINELTLAFAQKSFGLLQGIVVIGILHLLVCWIYGIYRGILGLQKRGRINRSLEAEKLPELISKFGKVKSIEVAHIKRLILFERAGTLFGYRVTPIATFGGEVARVSGLKNEIQFSLPNTHEQFYIQKSKLLFLFKKTSECPKVKLTMPKDFLFHSRNPQFLANLIAKDNIRGEIYKYQSAMEFGFAFEHGIFTLTCHRDFKFDGESVEIEAEGLEQICQTAVVFYDELAKK